MAWEKDSEGREYKKKKSGITKYRSKKDARDAIDAYRSIGDRNRDSGENNKRLEKENDKNKRKYERIYGDDSNYEYSSNHYVEDKNGEEEAKFSRAKDAEKYRDKRENNKNKSAERFLERKRKKDLARNKEDIKKEGLRKLSCGGSVKRSKGGLLKRGFNLSI